MYMSHLQANVDISQGTFSLVWYIALITCKSQEKLTDQNPRKHYFSPGNSDLWPMTLTFNVDHDITQVYVPNSVILGWMVQLWTG